MKMRLLYYLLFLLFLSSCINKGKNEGLIAKNGMVVSAREEASKIGVEILKLGGNAFDAMIATDLALAVSYQSAGNIGGGGFMVYRMANGETGALDYREKAPLTSSKDMYLDDNGNIIKGMSLAGGMAVGVPGTIAGIFEVHKKFGSLPIEQLFQPAIDLANDGIVVIQSAALVANQSKELLTQPLIVEGGKTLTIKAGSSDSFDIAVSYLNIKKEVTS